jgi:hypothetical protein
VTASPSSTTSSARSKASKSLRSVAATPSRLAGSTRGGSATPVRTRNGIET